jgi:tripeptide aminopeptidase
MGLNGGVIDAREFVAEDADRLLDEWGRIALIPAPEGGEGPRAELIANLAEASGANAAIDAAGNVVATVDGDDPDGETLTLLATMDDLGTVAAHRAATDRLHRDGERFVGPATETTSSDATALSILRFVGRETRPWRRLIVAWVLGEETGLTGVRALVDQHGTELGSVIDLMGGVGTVSWNAIGFAGLEVEFAAEPRHTLYGGTSEVPAAISRFIAALDSDGYPRHAPPFDADPLTVRRVNRVHAGNVFNHSPATGTVGIDIRSTDPTVLAEVEAVTRAAAEQVARQAGVEVRFSDGERQPAITLPGGREHRLVQALATAIRDIGREPVLRSWSSSNINIVYAAGLDGIVHDSTHRGGGRGTADEWTDIPGVLDGVAADCRMLQLLAPRSQ